MDSSNHRKIEVTQPVHHEKRRGEGRPAEGIFSRIGQEGNHPIANSVEYK